MQTLSFAACHTSNFNAQQIRNWQVLLPS